MCFEMFVKLPLLSKASSTLFTTEWFDSSMDSQMISNIAFLVEFFQAMRTIQSRVHPFSFIVVLFRFEDPLVVYDADARSG